MVNRLINTDWVARLTKYRHLYVGFSGGVDSTVLLHQLIAYDQLRNKITAIHINHGLNQSALDWQKHCQQFCHDHQVNLIIKPVEFERTANIEENARNARMQAFSTLLTADDSLLLAHHQDDQAETLLLQLFRGAGIDGLAAMSEQQLFAKFTVCRPLLCLSKQQLLNYAALNDLKWVEDDSNRDIHYARNYIRQSVMPILKAKWPSVVTSLARSAIHCQQAQKNLSDLAKIDCNILPNAGPLLPLIGLSSLSRARLTNVIRSWLANNKIRLPSTVILTRVIDELILPADDLLRVVEWGTIKVQRSQQCLYLLEKNRCSFQNICWFDFPKSILIPGLGHLHASVVATSGIYVPKDSHVEVRFRQGGELFIWHKQKKQLKKLMQMWKIPCWQRQEIPLIYIDGILAVIVGFAVSDLFYRKPGILKEHYYCIELERLVS
ncbi:MAG: tRNA lysidine(34) synthetase TilS [Legionella sp.]